MSAKFDFEAAKSDGYSDADILQFLRSQGEKFDYESAAKDGYSPSDVVGFLEKQYNQPDKKPSGPVTLKGAAGSYAAGLGGGAGGIGGDVLNLIRSTGGFHGDTGLGEAAGLKGTHELSPEFAQSMGVAEPQNALERILRASGEFGGNQSVVGAALGGPVGAATEAVHGSIAGALYGSLKELGMNDLVALGITTVVAASPAAANRLISNLKAGKGLKQAVQAAEKEAPGITQKIEQEVQASSAGQPPPPPGAPPPGAPPPGRPPSSWMRLEPEMPSANKPPPSGEPPPPPGAPPSSSSVISAPKQYLKSDFELSQAIKEALPEEIAHEPRAVARTNEALFSPVKKTLDEITPNRMSNPNLKGRQTARIIQNVDRKIYKESSKAWDHAIDLAGDVKEARPGLAGALRQLARENASPSKGATAMVENFAEKLYKKLRRKGEYLPISNADLIRKIQEARKGYDYQYVGGVEGHRINEFIETVEKELLQSAGPAERRALLAARQATKDWATVFKNKQVLPYRDQLSTNPQKLYNQSMSPDTLNTIIPILEQHHMGAQLAKILKRDLVERTLEPHLLKPKSLNPAKLERGLGKLEGILSEAQSSEIRKAVAQAHAESLSAKSSAIAKKSFKQMSSTETASKLRTIEGLRDLKQQLSTVKDGDKVYDMIAKTQGIDLLFGGQIEIPARAQRITNMINDRNGRFYLIETLGVDTFNELQRISKSQRNLERLLDKVHNSAEINDALKVGDIAVKSLKIGGDIVKGNFLAAGARVWSLTKDVIKKFGKEKPPAPSAPAENFVIR